MKLPGGAIPASRSAAHVRRGFTGVISDDPDRVGGHEMKCEPEFGYRFNGLANLTLSQVERMLLSLSDVQRRKPWATKTKRR